MPDRNSPSAVRTMTVVLANKIQQVRGSRLYERDNIQIVVVYHTQRSVISPFVYQSGEWRAGISGDCPGITLKPSKLSR